MAKEILKTNYKNDVLADSMNGRRKYRMINNSDGTVSFQDVTEYEQNGTDFSASDVNSIAENINLSASIQDVVAYSEYCSDITTEINFDNFYDAVNLPKKIDSNTQGKLSPFRSGVRNISFLDEETAIITIVGFYVGDRSKPAIEIRKISKSGDSEILATGSFSTIWLDPNTLKKETKYNMKTNEDGSVSFSTFYEE